MRVRIETATRKQKDAALACAMSWLKEEAMPKVTRNVEAIVLWQLHTQFGFGKKRLLKFLEETSPMIQGMLEYYDFDKDADAIWTCEHKLKTELGIDLSQMESPFSTTIKVKKNGGC
jgi:hypothetical protein